MSPFLTSMGGWGAARRRWTVAIFTLTVFPIAVWIGCWMGTMFVQADAESYLGMARGKAEMLPFASRQLGPMLARGIARQYHLPAESAFFDLGLASLLIFLGTTSWLLVRSDAPRWMIYALAGLMFWGFQFNALVMPDLLYATLVCGFLLLLRQGWVVAACLMMFPLMVTRESTLLTLVCFLIAGWNRLRKAEVATAVIAAGAAMGVVQRLATNALPNQEHISPMLYLIAKMPWNFMRNVLGIGVWANLYPSCEVPRWQMEVPLGALRAIGICGFLPEIPARAFAVAMAMFGLLPLLLLRVWNVARRTGGREDLMLRFALLYGAVSFLMAPVLGEAFPRLYGYGWPLFLVALPILLRRSESNFVSGWAAAGFVALHWFLTWALSWAYPTLLFPVALLCWTMGGVLLLKTFRVESGQSTRRDAPNLVSCG